MNIFTNMMQGPSRALINDVVAPEYLQAANAIASAVMALAAIVGSVIGANTTELEQPYFVLLCSSFLSLMVRIVHLCLLLYVYSGRSWLHFNCVCSNVDRSTRKATCYQRRRYAIQPTPIIDFHLCFRSPPEPKKRVIDTLIDIYRGFRYMPRSLGFIALLYFLSWCA